MGVDITTYRIRIGSFSQGNGTFVSAVKSPFKLDCVLHAVGTVVFIGILLVISGIEQNPGPIFTGSWILVIALLVHLVGVYITYWKTCTCLLLVFVLLFLASRSWKNDKEQDVFMEKDNENENSAEKLLKNPNADKRALEMLKKLGLVVKYSEQIRMRDLITVSQEEHTNENLEWTDLPWTFLSKVISMNSNAMNFSQRRSKKDTQLNSVLSLYESCAKTEVEECISPLDLIILVLQCCDPMVKQMIFSRLLLCKLAFPFLYTNVLKEPSMYIWPLRSISIGMEHESVLDLKVNTVAFARFGRPHFSKSNLLNNILKCENTFLHRNYPGGMNPRYLTQGFVEMFFLPFAEDGDNKFHSSITFFNIRGDIASYDENVTLFLSELSDTIAIFSDIDSIVKESSSLNQTILKFQKVILVITSDLAVNDGTSGHLFRFVENIRKNENTTLQIICTHEKHCEKITAKLVEDISDNIENHLSDKCTVSLSARLEKMSIFTPKSDENNECIAAKKSAFSFMIALEKESDGHETLAKVITPVQTLSFDISQLLKQLNKCDDGVEKVEEIKTKIIKIRKRQLHEISKPVLMFIDKLLQYSNKQSSLFYYLCWLQYFLERKKRKVLPRLMQKNKAAWDKYREKKTEEKVTSSKVNEYEKSIKDIESKIEKASFGLDHLFREIGQICDTIINLGDNVEDRTKLPSVQDLSDIVASLVFNGFSFELLDGNNFYMTLKWTDLVFCKINKHIGNARVMTLSVLGVQSSGKSTLLNTMFGLQLSTCAGRCTRGISAHLLPIKHTGNKPFEYIIVLDTEGLRAPELSERNYKRDNKLATIITGLGDTTLLNIMGENSVEMKNILQIIVHALIRLQLANKNLRMHKDCYFIHQNVTDINAQDRLTTSRQLLVRNLDTATRESAECELLKDITRFSQIMEFDTEKNVWYLQNLWLGNPPMARVNIKYSEKILHIRKSLIGRALCAKDKSFKNLNEIVILTEDLWKGVLSEDFVFSFRNSLEKKAYTVLEKKMKIEIWEIDRDIDDAVYQLASNHSSQCDNQDNLRTKKHEVFLEMKRRVVLAKGVALENIDLFYKDNSFKDIIIQWKEQSLNRIRFYSDEVIEKKKLEIDRIFNKREVDIMITLMHAVHEEELLNKSIELANELKGKNINETEVEQRFEEIWKKFVEESLSSSALNTTDLSMSKIFVSCLSDLFGQHAVLHEELSKHKMLNEDLKIQFLSGSFKKSGIEKTDLNRYGKKIVKFFKKVFKSDPLVMVEKECESCFALLDAKIDSLCKNEKEITSHEVKQFVQQVYFCLQKIQESLDQTVSVKITFIIKAMVHISSFACTRFEAENLLYQKSHGIHARLEKYKSQVKIRFYSHLNDRKAEETAAALLRHALEVHIKDAVRDSMPMKVKQYLRGKLPMIKRHLILDILTELMSENSFSTFQKYIEFPEEYGCHWISELAYNYLFSPGNKNYSVIAEKEITLYLEDINLSVSKVSNQLPGPLLSIDAWLKDFNCNLDKYKFPKECFRDIYREKERLGNLHGKHFVKNLRKELDKLKNSLLNEFDSETRKSVKWEGKNPINELCDELWGCKAQCIFCGEPCIRSDMHAGTNHICLQHRPPGCRGVHYEGTRHIVLTSCNYAIVSNEIAECSLYKFLCNPEYKCECDQKSHPYRDYKKFLPDWDIEPATDMEDRSKFWMWFIAKYKDPIENHWHIDVSIVPSGWDLISSEEALSSLSQVYSTGDDT